jgi:hypothetical protein
MRDNLHTSSYWDKAEEKTESWEYVLWSLLTILIAFVCYTFYYDATHYEKREVGAIVIQHNVTGQFHNTYSTIIKTDDGFIEEVTGLGIYTTPIGNRVRVKLRREKLKQ